MVILLETSKTVKGKKLDAVCNAYAREYDSEEIQEMEIPFTLTEAPMEDTRQLKPVNADAVSGIIMGKATIQKTSLGVDVRIPVTITDDKKVEKIMEIAVDGLESGKGGGLVLENDGIWYFHISMCKGELSYPMTVRFYDWDEEMVGKIKFK